MNNQRASKPNEIDLHGHSTGVALSYFVDHYNSEARSGNAFKVIHGYGSTGQGGEIRSRLRTFLKEQSVYLRFETGEQIDGNAGYTVIYPSLPLPPLSEIIAEKIMKFCSGAGKSEDKILGEFRLYGDIEVQRAIKQLTRQGRLCSRDKGRIKVFETSQR